MSTSSGYVLAGHDLEKLDFWWWYHWAVRSGWKYPFPYALEMWRMSQLESLRYKRLIEQ